MNIGYRATGTMRENRIKNCPLKTTSLMKKEERGSYDYRFDTKNEILIVKWLDNKCVIVGTNYDTVQPVGQVLRWKKNIKEKGYVPQPHTLNTYSENMGGVDKHDRLVSKYPISVRGKKWYWLLFIRMIDMAIVNAWVIYIFVNKGKKGLLSLLDFKRSICVAYLKGSSAKPSMGREHKASGPPCNIKDDIRFDMKGHIIIVKCEQQCRCQNKPCTAKPTTYCQKCNITLFKVFRSISPKNDLIVYYRNLVLYFERDINCILRGIECYYEIPVSYTGCFKSHA